MCMHINEFMCVCVYYRHTHTRMCNKRCVYGQNEGRVQLWEHSQGVPVWEAGLQVPIPQENALLGHERGQGLKHRGILHFSAFPREAER